MEPRESHFLLVFLSLLTSLLASLAIGTRLTLTVALVLAGRQIQISPGVQAKGTMRSVELKNSNQWSQ